MQVLIGLAMLTLVLACIACGLGAMLLDARDKNRELQLELEELRGLRGQLFDDRTERMWRASGAEPASIAGLTNLAKRDPGPLPTAYSPDVLGHREPHEGAIQQAPMRRAEQWTQGEISELNRRASDLAASDRALVNMTAARAR